jgi:hypothetical protein
MHEQSGIQSEADQGLTAVDREVASQLVQRLDQFLAPLLVVLDAYVDSRLVRTLVDLLVSLVQLRHREAGVLMSELGAMLLSPQHGPAASKRISRLLQSPQWGSWRDTSSFCGEEPGSIWRRSSSVARPRCSCMMGAKLSNRKACGWRAGVRCVQPKGGGCHVRAPRSTVSAQRLGLPSWCQASIGTQPS